jgi:hypothetical protein
MPKNDLLNPSILKSLFDTNILAGGKRRTIGNTTYSESGDRLWLMAIFICFHIVSTMNVAKLCDLTSSASPVILGMFGGYVGGFFLLVLILYIIGTGKRKPKTLKRWSIFLLVFLVILMTFAIIAMAMSNEGSSEDKGYGYTSVLLINFGMLFLVWYVFRIKIRTVAGSKNDISSTLTNDYQSMGSDQDMDEGNSGRYRDFN